MPRLLIIYHSRTGGSRQMAEAAYEAARDELDDTHLLKAEDTQPEDLLNAQGGSRQLARAVGAIWNNLPQHFSAWLVQYLKRFIPSVHSSRGAARPI